MTKNSAKVPKLGRANWKLILNTKYQTSVRSSTLSICIPLRNLISGKRSMCVMGKNWLIIVDSEISISEGFSSIDNLSILQKYSSGGAISLHDHSNFAATNTTFTGNKAERISENPSCLTGMHLFECEMVFHIMNENISTDCKLKKA